MEIISLKNTTLSLAARRAADVLKKGGIVLYPTDTIYGLGVDATNIHALRHLKELKGRDKKKPISVIVQSVDAIDEYAVMNEPARRLADQFLPGALTLVLPATNKISNEITLNGAIGIRIPNEPFCQALAETFGKPFTTTSANKAGRETPKNVSEVLKQLGHATEGIALVIDDGPRESKNPSTVVLCVSDIPHVSREGAISRAELGL